MLNQHEMLRKMVFAGDEFFGKGQRCFACGDQRHPPERQRAFRLRGMWPRRELGQNAGPITVATETDRMSLPVSLSVSIAQALSAIDREDDAAALDQLLHAWAETRSGLIGVIIELVSLNACGWHAMKAEPQLPQIDQLLEASPLGRGPLLRQLAHHRDRSSDAVARESNAWLDALLRLPPDPRVAAVLDAFSLYLDDELYDYPDDDADSWAKEATFRSSHPIAAKFRQVCGRHRDWRLSTIEHGEPVLIPPSTDLLTDHQEQALRAAEQTLRRRLFDDPGDRNAVARWAVHPDDSGAMKAYAEWLADRGDPRGAHLLGMPAGSAFTLQELESLWLGPIQHMATVMLHNGLVVRIKFPERKQRTGMEGFDWQASDLGWRPGWSAVRRIDDAPADLLASVALPGLRWLSCAPDELEAALRNGTRLNTLHTLELPSAWGPPSPESISRLRALLRHPGLAGLHGLTLHWCHDWKERRGDMGPETFAPLLADPCGVQALNFSTVGDDAFWAAHWLHALRENASPLQAFQVYPGWVLGHTSPSAVDWQDVKADCHSFINHFTAKCIGELVKAGARRVRLIAEKEPEQDVLDQLRRFHCELHIEIRPAGTAPRT